jgi:ribosomal protein S13
MNNLTSEEITKLKNKIVESWNELEVLRDSMELDLAKSLNGVRTAGVRTRKGLKLMSQQAQMIKKQLLQLQKLFNELKKNN